VVELLCNGCVVCCQKDAVIIHPEKGDDIKDYRVEFFRGRFMLAHKKNGDCIYLDRLEGCTIYDRRPYVCGNLDCRVWLTLPSEISAMLQKRHFKAARGLKKRMKAAKRMESG